MKKQLLILITLAASLSNIARAEETQSSQEITFNLESGQIIEKKYAKQWNKMHIARNLSFTALNASLGTVLLIGKEGILQSCSDRLSSEKQNSLNLLLTCICAALGLNTCKNLYNAYSGASSMIEHNEEVTDPEVKQEIMQILCNSKTPADISEEKTDAII